MNMELPTPVVTLEENDELCTLTLSEPDTMKMTQAETTAVLSTNLLLATWNGSDPPLS